MSAPIADRDLHLKLLALIETALGRLGGLHGDVQGAHRPLSEAIDLLHDALDRDPT